MERNYVVCDLETTGLNPQTDRIIEVGLVRIRQGEIVDKYHTMVNPGMPLPLKIKRITGIDDYDLADAPAIADVISNVVDYIGNDAIVGHNINFDLGFLSAAHGLPLNNPHYDTVELARLLLPGAVSYRLESLCSKLEIDAGGSHRALNDALAAANLMVMLLRKMRDLDLGILIQLNKLLGEAHSEWNGPASELIKELLTKFPDRKISHLSYLRRAAEKENQYPRSVRGPSAGEKLILEQEDVVSLLKEGGPLADVLPAYEYRPQQEAMVCEVTRALNESKFLLMEAGTGVGKSIAYLLPAILWSIKNKERVLVATHTINLQEQLWFKDIPMLTEIIKDPFHAALAKGRQNYICLRRWFGALDSPHQPDEAAFFARVLLWLGVTETGDRSELNTTPAESDIWLTICGETEGCLGPRCPYQKDCFVSKARKNAENADLIITNHSLLFSDIKAENRVLPSFGPLVIDEAHHLEESATTHLGIQFNKKSFNRWLWIAGRELAKLSEKAPPADGAKWFQMLKTAQETRLELLEASRLFFEQLYEMVSGSAADTDYVYSSISLRLPFTGESFEVFLENGRRCVNLLRNFAGDIKACAGLMEIWALSEEAWAGLLRDTASLGLAGETLAGDLHFILENIDTRFVYWADLEVSSRAVNRNCSLNAAPVDVGRLLFDRLFNNKETVVLTSATLTVSEGFDHIIERTGLNYLSGERLLKTSFDSPFSYDSQAMLCINRDLPVQGAVNDDIYLEKLENALNKLIVTAGGRTLVLFTSHRILREAYRRLKPLLEIHDICLLGHGIDGSRSRLLEEFRGEGRTALFGSLSFWEGIDVPGDALACVIIVKLPFASPSVPVIEARLEDLASQGKDGFKLLSVPQAVIRFKQGFGRLIRSSSDHGCVVVLDGRVLNKSYGRQFLISLPVRRHLRGGIDFIAKKVAEWLENNQDRCPRC
ncbi:helicase C-terminal domain-containing protein [Pelotomaculum propionicicum]|uniref:helicase C-terminal domain-containing protein n=1 Tax=Pelotomaculum propionicicum TaxID=258475 RepID=UPI003B76A75C